MRQIRLDGMTNRPAARRRRARRPTGSASGCATVWCSQVLGAAMGKAVAGAVSAKRATCPSIGRAPGKAGSAAVVSAPEETSAVMAATEKSTAPGTSGAAR